MTAIQPDERVALLAEGVDRNVWKAADQGRNGPVALLAEGVDRNIAVHIGYGKHQGRPPRGGRG